MISRRRKYQHFAELPRRIRAMTAFRDRVVMVSSDDHVYTIEGEEIVKVQPFDEAFPPKPVQIFIDDYGFIAPTSSQTHRV